MRHIITVGGGQSGASLVARLRTGGFDGKITLICGENAPPYQRPPLSKAYLLGDMTRDRLFLRPKSFYSETGVDLVLGQRVRDIDRAAKTIRTDDAAFSYDDLVLTTGSTPNRLPATMGGDLDGVFVVRGLSDVDAMAPRFQAGARVLIVGGGYIGLEAAAVASKLGLQVTLIEMAPRILQRVASAHTSDYFRALHAGHGVDLREGTGLDRLTGTTAVSGAVLSDGTTLDVDFVIVGVGVAPDTALAEMAALEIDNGIKTDVFGRTSDPAIWAAGDCASFPYGDARVRLESVQNAIDQAECVADNLLGAETPYHPQPWFWSDQYDVKLQIAGLNSGYDRTVVRPGEGASQSVWYYAGTRLCAVDAMNDPRSFMVAKRLLAAGISPAPERVADPASDLKALMAS